jgi:hypothetical protein
MIQRVPPLELREEETSQSKITKYCNLNELYFLFQEV